MEEGEMAGDGGHAPGPMSLEEVLKKKQAAEQAAAKPVFLSRKQREALALER
jgi:ATP-dependent RNA helicase DDX23/PRP28